MEGIVLSFQEEGEAEIGSLLRTYRTSSAINSDSLFSHGARHSLLAEIKQKRLLSVTSGFRMRWDLFVLLLTLANSFSVPFEIAFLSGLSSVAGVVANLVITGAYAIDIFVQCRSTFLDETGTEVASPRIIAAKYFYSGRLLMDILAALPYELFDLISSEHIRLFSLLKMLRLMRLGKVIRFMRTNDKTKLKIELGQLIVIFLLYLHLQACFWFMLTYSGGVYIPPAQYIHTETVLEGSIWRQYAYSLYMSVYLLTAAEIGPRTEWERIVAGCFILSGQLFQAFMFGKIAVVLFNLNAKTAELAEIEDASATTMMNMQLPAYLQNKVIAYLVTTHSHSLGQGQYEDFFKMLPRSLQQEVHCVVFKPSLMLDKGLSHHPALFGSVLRRLTNLYCQPEKNVIVQGDEADALYFIMKGVCEVAVLDELKREHHVSLLPKGSHFGEIGLVYNSVRTASVCTQAHATLAVLSKEDFLVLSQRDKRLTSMFRDSAVRYTDPWRQFLISTLSHCQMLRNVSVSTLKEISYFLKPVHIESNVYICKEGDVAETVTFIVDGQVEIYVPLNDMRLQSFPSDVKLDRDMRITQKMRFRRGSLLALNQTMDMRFIVKISMDQIGAGSVILPNLPILKEKVNFYAKTTELTTVLCLNMQVLSSLCKQFPDLRDAIRAYRRILQSSQEENSLHFVNYMSLDYEKHIPASALCSDITLWTAKMTVRRSVLGKILRQRVWRQRGTAEMRAFARKLASILRAELDGDRELAEKVRRSVLPSNGEAVWALRLLTKEEAGWPLMAQLAYQVSQMSLATSSWTTQLSDVWEQAQVLSAQKALLKDDLDVLRTLVQLSVRLCSSSASNWNWLDQPQ